MGVNFPTAFWKGSDPSDEDVGISIDWDLYLYYNTASNIGAGLVQSSSGPSFSQISSAHPYSVDDSDYYFNYVSTREATSPNAFFGWLLDGYSQNNLEGYHRANPFILDSDGRELNLFFEADQETVDMLSRENTYSGPESDSERYFEDTFNHFIQSGYAQGSFTLSSTSNLSIQVSGLGEKYDSNYDKMHLAVDDVHICKGQSPGGGTDEWNMNQVKLFNSAGTQTPNPAPSRAGGTYVNQDNRRFGYTTAGGQATFTTPADPLQDMAAGEHSIKIYFNTNDGLYNSGAFYGFKFNFS